MNLRDSKTTVLFEDLDSYPFYVDFHRGEIGVGYNDPGGPMLAWFSMTGSPLRVESFQEPGQPACIDTGTGILINGRTYPGAGCGPASSDGVWMTFAETKGDVDLPGGGRVPTWDQWAINLQTDQRLLLQAGLRHCGGCDGRFGPEWSPSGRYLFFSEYFGAGKTFLSDVLTGTTEVIFEGDTQLPSRPDWSVGEDILLHPGPDGGVVMRDLAAETVTNVSEQKRLAWPARFDDSGMLIYSPGWGSLRGTGTGTTIIDRRSGALVLAVPGQPPYTASYLSYRPVAWNGEVTVAALDQAPGCDGVTVHVGSVRSFCVQAAQGASLSPDGRKVAVARKIATDTFDVVVVDLASQAELAVVRGVTGSQYPMPAEWDSSSTYLLIRSPFRYGP